MTDTRERDIIRAFVDLSNELADGGDLVDLLTQLAANCAHLFDAASSGLLLADEHGQLHLVAASSERTRDLETLQLQREEGPCLDSYRTGAPVVVPDLTAAEERWPQFTAAAAAAGFASVHALPMRLRHTVLGALGLFGDHPGELAPDDLDLAQALVHVASVAIVNDKSANDRTTINTQLQHALNSRVVLEQAKGFVAYAAKVDLDQAFSILRLYARAHNQKLTDIAKQVVNRDIDVNQLVGDAHPPA